VARDGGEGVEDLGRGADALAQAGNQGGVALDRLGALRAQAAASSAARGGSRREMTFETPLPAIDTP
jgi:hypothetical protein